MYEHHQSALDKLVQLLKPDPTILAVVTAGSIAQGKARESSDVDVYIVVTEESFKERQQLHQLAYTNHDVCDYPDGYIDGKIISQRFLELAAVQGSEPTRYSFLGSKAVYSRIPDLDDLLQTISTYPEQNREQNLIDFYSQIYLYAFYFAGEAAKKDNSYLLSHSVSNLVLFSGRAILAINRQLFPCHKGLMDAVQATPNKPEHFVQQANDLLSAPSYEKCMDLAKVMLGFHDPGISFEQALSLFVSNNEWNWIDHEPPLTDR
ncbi:MULTISPECIES: nucleotidyltransferase domain-containing protein [unclassified Paenibacillus]|uniref:nucleotidyltransferase domain-containing protein n=1 Tax=unclassified Paenibacillus TaxID=185978 RepID=UPI0009A8B586|nr:MULTISPECIES: nucleotidyltransferase domain-containing protein [unclassified Paenibacillus]SLK20885.1 Nucleotidyltransferase domain-containing protein [Paenibacillus sp. RU5A]SOC76351.1 Nucleotidyltransferase domain-containing protein [Paenibacillus sp. RU26A]SOC77943.1 Nucleotidyltransferase domain-containing protein [Paenibacillus sp. RU5M]